MSSGLRAQAMWLIPGQQRTAALAGQMQAMSARLVCE
jgi:hypothetical protein